MKVISEEQKFRNLLIYTALGASYILSLYHFFKDWDSIQTKDLKTKLIAVSAFLIINLVVIIFIYIKLKTKIDEKGIHYQYVPFHRNEKLIAWNEISKVIIKKYNPLAYGGWGIKFNLLNSHEKHFTVSGNMGIFIFLKNGKTILLGTKKPNEIQLVLNNYQEKLN